MNKLKISFATGINKNYIFRNDHSISKKTMKRKIRLKEYLVANINKKPIGFLRFGYFWSEIPIVEMIIVEEKLRKKGIGRTLIKSLEKIAKKNNQKVIISSSTGNEKNPKKWHEHMGFKKVGSIKHKILTRSIPEVFFVKVIK